MPEEQGYRIPDVLRLARITYRQLDYWARTSLVRPSVRDAEGSGTQRLYSFEDVLQLKLIKQLLDTGVSLQKVRPAIEYLRANGRAPQSATLLSDGRRIFLVESPEEIYDLMKNGQGVFAIDIEPIRSDLQRAVEKRARASRAGGA